MIIVILVHELTTIDMLQPRIYNYFEYSKFWLIIKIKPFGIDPISSEYTAIYYQKAMHPDPRAEKGDILSSLLKRDYCKYRYNAIYSELIGLSPKAPILSCFYSDERRVFIP